VGDSGIGLGPTVPPKHSPLATRNNTVSIATGRVRHSVRPTPIPPRWLIGMAPERQSLIGASGRHVCAARAGWSTWWRAGLRGAFNPAELRRGGGSSTTGGSSGRGIGIGRGGSS
jgi:hypothetical protein